MHDLAKSEISLIAVSTEKEILRYNLDQLAMELTGKPVTRMFPIYIVFHHGKCRGYFIAPTQTVIYPAIHPEMAQLHEYEELIRSLVTEVKRATGNPVFLLCERAGALSEKILRAFRLKRSTNTAYEYCED